MKKRSGQITRSYDDRWVAGVLSGLAHYFGWNVMMIRVLYIVVMVITGIFPAVVVYLILFSIMPADPAHPGILDFFKSLSPNVDRMAENQSNRRRTLTDVEEHDLKKNRSSK